MAKTEYKVLAPFNLPYIGDDGNGKMFRPGQFVSHEEIEEYAEHAAAAVDTQVDDHTPAMTAEETVKHFIDQGVLSKDADADFHPDHRPVDPAAPTIARVIEQAKQLIEIHGEDNVPDEVKQLAAIEHRHVTTGDNGQGGDQVG
jgi:hypothetical protein